MIAAAGPLLGVPWYVHPAEAPERWDALAGLAPRCRFVVANVHDGPGGADDPWYPRALVALHRHVPVLGYVDLAYGDRPRRLVLDDVAAWVARYQVDGVFLDQVPSAARAIVGLAQLAEATRRLGAGVVVANPGVVPSPDHLEVFDVTCTFEADAEAYTWFEPPAWLRAVPADRVWHLVHGCPPGLVPALLDRAGRTGAGVAWVTEGVLPNPWDRLPAALTTPPRPADAAHLARGLLLG